MKTAVIANLHSAAGRTGKRWPALRQQLENRLGPLEVCFTEGVGHASELARGLLLRGFDRIVGVGGDGTFSEIANGFIENGRPIRAGASMGILPTGTGGDLRRTLAIPVDTDAAIEVLATGVPLNTDLGRITFDTHWGERQTRYFLNVTSFGISGDVSAGAKNVFQIFGGKAAFFWATLKAFATYRGKPLALALDDEPVGVYQVLHVAAGIGLFHGGGMYVCPLAVLNDGMIEVTVIEDLGILTLLRDIRYLYNGAIYDHPKVRHFRARKVAVTSSEVVRIEVDGEPLGRLPVEVTLLPRAMSILVPKTSPLLA